jgi:hypothetical protein
MAKNFGPQRANKVWIEGKRLLEGGQSYGPLSGRGTFPLPEWATIHPEPATRSVSRALTGSQTPKSQLPGGVFDSAGDPSCDRVSGHYAS